MTRRRSNNKRNHFQCNIPFSTRSLATDTVKPVA